MGINFATEMVRQNLPNEVKMWRAVINNALGDVTINSSDRKSSLYKFAVHDWIIQNSDDFQQVCYYAELDPENIRRQYMRAIKLKKILFTDRQLKWKKYNDNYQKLKTIKCREERKKLRKIVEYLRQLVFKSTNKIIEI
tara:strand:- start:268 stop:684 length:417 start_codon:yes stop_codon:yes gene_type:complete